LFIIEVPRAPSTSVGATGDSIRAVVGGRARVNETSGHWSARSTVHYRAWVGSRARLPIDQTSKHHHCRTRICIIISSGINSS